MESPAPSIERSAVADLLAQLSDYCDDLEVFLNDEIAVMEDLRRRAADHCREALARAQEDSRRQLEEESQRRLSIEEDLASCRASLEQLQIQAGETDEARRAQQAEWEERLEALRAELQESGEESERVQLLEREVAETQERLAEAKSQMLEQAAQCDEAQNQVSDAQQHISELEGEVEHLQAELKITKSRLSEEKRRAVEDRADAAAELKLLRRALEVKSREDEPAVPPEAVEALGPGQDDAPPGEEEPLSAESEPGETADPVLDAVMAQFQQLQSSAAEAMGG